MSLFVSHLSLKMLKFLNLTFEDSSETWCYFRLKVRVETEISHANIEHQVKTSNLQGHALSILTV